MSTTRPVVDGSTAAGSAGDAAVSAGSTASAGAASGGGLVLALGSAACFATSGPLAKALLDAGWSPGAAVTARIAGAALVLAVPAAISLRGRWSVLRTHAGLVALYGLMAVAAAQLGFFSAVRTVPVGTALLIEYLAPLLVVAWVWAVQRRRPGIATGAGAAVAVAGVVLVLDVVGGASSVDPVGVGWALLAACGLAGYFLMGEREARLPPLALAAGGLLVAAVVLALAGAVGFLPMVATTDRVVLAGHEASPLLVLAGLALLSAAVAYTTGTAAARRLGSRLASFVGLTEVLFAVTFSWLLLGQALGPLQLLGGGLVVLGVVVVRLDRTGGRPTATPAAEAGPALR